MTTPSDPFQKPPPGDQPPPLPPGYGPPPPGYGPPPPGYGQPQQQWGQWQQPYQPKTGTNGMAIASLVCGLTGCVYGIPAILAIVFGFIARSQIKQSQQDGNGLALGGIILGFAWIVLGVVAVIGLFVFGESSVQQGCVTSDGGFC